MNIKTQQLIAGVSWDWTESVSNYPAPTYSLLLILKKYGANAVELESIASGTDHNFTQSAVQTATITAGDYFYQLLATDGTEKYLLETGSKNIQALLSAANLDPRGQWDRILEKLYIAYEEAAEVGWAEMTLNGRTVRYDRAQLLTEINNAEAKKAQADRVASGKKKNRTFLVRLS